jgi:hypothetical protein
MFKITDVWKALFQEEYEIVVYLNKKLTKKNTYAAKKVIKSSPKHFVWVGTDGKKHELKFVNPVNYHITKLI